MGNLRVSAYDSDGKQHFKSVNTNHYTEAEIKVIELHFKKHIHANKDAKDFRIKEILQAFPVASSVAVTAKPKDMFEFRSMETIEAPKNGGFSFAILGSTRAGKSTLMIWLYEHFFKKDITFLMTLSNHIDIYKPLKSKAIICPDYMPSVIENAIKINKETKNHYDFCFIFDDLSINGKNDKTMTRLTTTGRNQGCSLIYNGQKLTMLSATGRSNINIICMFRQITDTATEDIIKTYLRSWFPKGMKMNEMIAEYKRLTSDYHFIVLNTLTDEVFLSKIDISQK